MEKRSPYTPKKFRYYTRLPHWQAIEAIYFVTFRLQGSLPRKVIQHLKDERDLEKEKLIKRGLAEHEIQNELSKLPCLYYGKFDHLLDSKDTGPHYLKNDDIAKIVADAIMFFDEQQYVVINYTIMSNHVHLILFQLQKELFEILGSIKKYSARIINQQLHLSGTQFWQYESFDHIIRNERALQYYIQYNLLNPVKAGLISDWRDWKWNYVRDEFRRYAP